MLLTSADLKSSISEQPSSKSNSPLIHLTLTNASNIKVTVYWHLIREEGAFGVVPGQVHKTDRPHFLFPQLRSKAGKLELILANHTPCLGAGFPQQDGQRHPQMQLNIFNESSAAQRCPALRVEEDLSYMKCFHYINLDEYLQGSFCQMRLPVRKSQSATWRLLKKPKQNRDVLLYHVQSFPSLVGEQGTGPKVFVASTPHLLDDKYHSPFEHFQFLVPVLAGRLPRTSQLYTLILPPTSPLSLMLKPSYTYLPP